MKKKNKKLKQGIYLLPNSFTTVNLFLGFFSIINTFMAFAKERPELYAKSALAIIIAIVFDTLDGKIARLTKTTSQFGVEYDSLADLSTFGIAPALLMYAWGLNYFGRLGWLAVFLYFACVALRLARFNTQSQTVEKSGFEGLPCPAAAGLVASIILLKPVFLIETKNDMLYVLFLPYLLAISMVSNLKYRNFKEIDFKKRFSFSVLLAVVVLVIIVAYRPKYTICVIFVSYFALGIVENFYKWFSKKKRLELKKAKAIQAEENSPN